MQIPHKYRFVIVVALAVCVSTAWSICATSSSPLFAQSDAPADLFTETTPPDGDAPPPDNPYILDEKTVFVVAEAIESESFILPLFDGRTVVAKRNSTQRSGDNILWRGMLEGYPGSSVTLIYRSGATTGAIFYRGEIFTLTPVDGNYHAFRKITPLAITEFDDMDLVTEPLDDRIIAAGLESLIAPAGNPVIDVMVVWTPLATSQIMASGGGTGAIIPGATSNPGTIFTDMEEWVNFGIQLANEAYANSQSNLRLRLVHAQEVSYTETSGGTPLTTNVLLDELNAGSTGAGPLAAIQNLEQIYKADLVALLYDETNPQAGRGNLPRTTGAFNRLENKSVTRWDLIFPNFTFAHEFGHNLGLAHNLADAGTIPYFRPDAYGHLDPAGYYRTIMSYSSCGTTPPTPPNCQRINYFSNPAVNFPAPSGNPSGTGTANNGTAIDAGAALVKDYRAHVYDIAIGDTLLTSGDVFGEWDDGAANEACVTDQDGNDDVGGVDDATRHCVATNQVDQLYLLQSIDETSFGADPTVTCSLIDTGPDQFIDYALCSTFTDDGAGGVSTSAQLFTCNNTSTNTCAGAVAGKMYNAILPLSGGHYSNGAYYFGNDENGPFGNLDAQLEIQIPYTDMGIVNGDNLCTKLATFPDTGSLTAPIDEVLQAANYLEYDTDDGTGGVGQCTTTLEIEKTTSAPLVDVAGSVDYTIKVTNTGSVIADATLTDIFPSVLSVGACTAKLTAYSFSTTEKELGSFPIEQANCTDASGATNVVEFMKNPFTGNPVTSPLTCVFNVPSQAQVTKADYRATSVARANATFELNEVQLISPAGTQSLQSTGNSGFDNSTGVANWSIPETYTRLNDPAFAGETAAGQWQFQFFDRGFNAPSVQLRIVPGAGNTEVTLYGYEPIETITNLTPEDLATGATHRIEPGDVLEYICPATIPSSICPASSVPDKTTVNNTASVTAMQDEVSLRTDNATFNVTTGDTCTTAIQLGSFSAKQMEKGISIAWTTAAEIDNAGFNLYASDSAEGPWIKLNEELIAAQGSVTDATEYAVTDESNAAYYMLEDIDTSGVNTMHGPISIGSGAEDAASDPFSLFLPLLQQ